MSEDINEQVDDLLSGVPYCEETEGLSKWDASAVEIIRALLAENKSLRDKLGEAEKVVDLISDHQTVPCINHPDSPACYLIDADEIEKIVSNYKGGNDD